MVIWAFFGNALLWDWKKSRHFPVLWPVLFSKLSDMWVEYFNSIIFRILNSSVGFLSPLLALFIVMFPRANLTSHSRMFSSRCMTTWLSRSLRPFLYSSVDSCYLFLISSAFVSSLLFLSFIMPIFAWSVPLISPIFFKTSLVFSILMFSSSSLHCSFKKAFLSLFGIL